MNKHLHSFPQVHDDTFNPLGIQGGGVHPLFELTFLKLQKPPSGQSVLNILKSKPHTPLASAPVPLTHCEL